MMFLTRSDRKKIFYYRIIQKQTTTTFEVFVSLLKTVCYVMENQNL